MEKEVSKSVLKKKAAKPLATDLGESQIVTRGLGLAFERAARDMMGLTFQVKKCTHSRIPFEDVAAALPEKSMWCLLENRAGETAALSVDLQLFAGLVEYQTLGCVLGGKAEERAPTRVDGALVMAVADEALSRFSKTTATEAHIEWAKGYRYGAMTQSKRALVLALVAEQFHFFKMEIALEGGAKTGVLLIAFPVVETAEDQKNDDQASEQSSELFQREVRQAPALLNAVLGRVTLSYSKLKNLKVGDTLALAADCLQEVSLEVPGQEKLTKATLGQLNGMRAIRLKMSKTGRLTQTYDPIAERPKTPDLELMKDTEQFLPPMSDASDVAAVAKPKESITPSQHVAEAITPLDDSVEDFSDLDDLEFDLPKLAAG